jgi:hypothetical protein
MPALALEISHRSYVFEIGKIALSEDSRALVEDSRIRKAYLGSSSSASCLPVSVPASVVSVKGEVRPMSLIP